MGEPALISLQEVRKFFELDGTEFRKQWMALDEKSRNQIRKGLTDGSLNY